MTIRVTWRRALVALLTLAAAGMLFAWSGIFNVAASSGHWAITDWFLHWTMRNSVRTHTLLEGVESPRDPSGLISAAGHFEQSCAVCHGAPGQKASPVTRSATPPAPDLTETVPTWTDAQLFWILKHGVKYTGMPAWPTLERKDEVRRMVGFIRLLPEMSVTEYRALVAHDGQGGLPTVPEARGLVACVGCHGADGRGRGQGDIPILGGQRADYLEASLVRYANLRRESGVMAAAAAPLDPDERRWLASYFAAMPGLGGGARPTSGAAAEIALRGRPSDQLPACVSCHDAGGRRPFPVIHGQRASYIAQRLRQWRGEETVVDARKPQDVMPVIARRIPEEMIDPLARWFAGE
ncbi:cytochrome c553 [Sphingomonas jejuensis]|uniref:Cytochrome c553 n=1 Tax=Sphingomonas jejuensis TaxID=904715 RepID=A0ABX0XMF1_9SPHN|nr:c-type cytochrome [Sphingomonas jejuensis]NJC33932.1 cytochrome c553 [Sphingomonas jejuensis]